MPYEKIDPDAPLKPSFEEEFGEGESASWSESYRRRYERGEITAAQAGGRVVAHEAEVAEEATETEEPYVRPTTAVPTKNADAGAFKPTPYPDLSPTEKLVADNDPPAHIRHN